MRLTRRVAAKTSSHAKAQRATPVSLRIAFQPPPAQTGAVRASRPA
jgi:hypothetical protein